MTRPVRTLPFSALYHSSSRPIHGGIIESRLRELLKSGAMATRVVASVPRLPSTNERWSDYARFARTPRREQRHGINVPYPRYRLPPKVGMMVTPEMLAMAPLSTLRKVQEEGFDFELIDAHYSYPDGVAAALLARHVGMPLLITARGSGLNRISPHGPARKMMRWASGRADASIGACNALVDMLHGWGIANERHCVMRNGVALQRFRPIAPTQARQRLGLAGWPLLLSVKNLVEVKGRDLTIDAFSLLLQRHAEARLAIIGAGPLRDQLLKQAESRGLASKISFVGRIANEQLADWYSAADGLLLASRSEGWANVLLESMACGTPGVATDVGGSAEVVTDPCAGELVRPRDATGIAQAVERLLTRNPDRGEVRRFAERFGWDSTTEAQLQLFNRLIGTSTPAGEGMHA